MKKSWSSPERLLFLAPLGFMAVAGGVWAWQQSRPLTIEIPGAEYISNFNFSPDSQRIVVFADDERTKFRSGHIYDVRSGSKIVSLAQPSQRPNTGARSFTDFRQPFWSPDGSRIVAGYDDQTRGTSQVQFPEAARLKLPPFRSNKVGKMAIWDARSGKLSGNYLYAPADEESISFVQFSDDGTQLVGQGVPAALFDAATGQRTALLKGTFAATKKIAFNGKLGLLAVTNSDGTRFQVFDTKTQKVLWSPRLAPVRSLLWHDEILAITTDNVSKKGQSHPKNELILWDSQKRVVLPRVSAYGILQGVNFSPDGRSLIYNLNVVPSNKNEFVVWDYLQNRVLWRYKTQFSMVWAQWSPDGQWIAASLDARNGAPATLLVFDRTGKLCFQPDGVYESHRWSPDSRSLAAIVQSGGKG
ncbi:MAG: WD40 repeat domain-containing protein, partial [Acetobacteraceae bacterium]